MNLSFPADLIDLIDLLGRFRLMTWKLKHIFSWLYYGCYIMYVHIFYVYIPYTQKSLKADATPRKFVGRQL